MKTLACSILVILLTAPGISAATEVTKPKGLVVASSPAITIDITNGVGRTLLRLRNDSDKPQVLLLSAGIPTETGSNKTAGATVGFAAENDTGLGTSEYQFSIQPKATGRVMAIVSNLWQTGQFETDLLNNSTKIGSLKVQAYPVNVRVDSATPENVSLNLVSGLPTRLFLKNEDPLSYDMSYRLLVSGRQIADGTFTIGPNGRVIVEFEPFIPIEWYNLGWYLSRFQDLFKPQAGPDDMLLLYLREPGKKVALESPIKRIPVQASFNFFSPTSRQALSYLVIITILILGGAVSLILSHLLPNRLQKLNIKEQLETLARTTANLSSHVGSRLGVIVRVERSRLYDLLTSRSTISPEFASVIAQCTEGLATLSTRVGMLQQMDLVMQRLADIVPLGVPPSQVDQIEANLDKASTFLGKDMPTLPELQAAQAAISDAASAVDALGRPNPTFGQDLSDRVQAMIADMKANFAARPTFIRITRIVPGPYALVTSVPAGALVNAARYKDVDFALAKVGLLREYVQLTEGTTDAAMLARLAAAESHLLGYLQLDTWEALRSARLLVREMQGDVYPERLQQALAANPQEAAISMEPPFAYERQPLVFKAEFQSQALDFASARDEWTCRWDFGDGLSERGWSVSHYYLLPKGEPLRRRPARVFTLAATFQDANGRTVTIPGTDEPVSLSREITVHPTTLSRLLGERTSTEVIKLAAALLIAVFGLVAGAQEQLLKLDLLPGMVAVFLVGFGADTIKNLLTTK